MTEKSIGKVLLLVADSEAARTATRFAALLAGQCGAVVTAFSVARTGEARADLERALAEAAATLGKSSTAPVETAIVEGDLTAEAAKRARDGYDVTIFGAAPRSGREGRRMSLAVWQLAKTVETPVFLVPPDATPALGKILLCTGGERYIEKGAKFVATVAACVGAEVTLLHILPIAPEMYRAWAPVPRSAEPLLAGESRLARQLKEQIAIFEKQGVRASLVLEESDSIERTIFDVRRRIGADLVVVGSSPMRGRIRTSVLGNVTRDVIVGSRVPVLIVRSSPSGLFRDLWKILREG
ncbi:MAG TPA: universal stress protein [Thermoanaerobaculia bacterium]|nr:universal stress protein [Thermoanaerobaculia bacterium]